MTSLAVLVQTPPFPPPPPPPPPEPPPFVGLGVTWQGWDGRTWDLTDFRGGVVLLRGAFEGLLHPPHERYSQRRAGRAGSRWRGGVDLERPVSFVVGVYSDTSSDDWLEVDRAFARTLDRRRPGVLTVHTPDGGRRSLVCRFEAVDADLDGDPVGDGWLAYGVQFIADEQPYWQGEVVDGGPFQLAGGAAAPDFIPATGGPPFHIAQASTLANATITNPGDLAAWPIWTVEDQATGITLGIGSDLIGVNVDTLAGDRLVIDTRRQAVLLNGERVRGILDPHDFAPIPARSTMPLNLSATGSGRVGVQVVPLYERAW